MKAQIVLPSMRIYARHGVYDQERAVGAWFRVSLSATVECNDRLIEADLLEGTVDYGQVVGCIRECMSVHAQPFAGASGACRGPYLDGPFPFHYPFGIIHCQGEPAFRGGM